jgi:hypothetical protein
MKISKYDILDGFTAGFGMSGAASALLLGGGFCWVWINSNCIIKRGKFISLPHQRLQEKHVYGALVLGRWAIIWLVCWCCYIALADKVE